MVETNKVIYSKPQLEKQLSDLRAKIKDEQERLSKVYVQHENMINAKVNVLVNAENELASRQKVVQEEILDLAGKEASITEKQSKVADDLNRMEILRSSNNQKLDAIDRRDMLIGEREKVCTKREEGLTKDETILRTKLSKVSTAIKKLQELIKGV